MKNEKLFNLEGKVAIVTGGYGVLGGKMAEHLATEGVNVAILGRSSQQLEEKVSALQAKGAEAIGLQASVLDEAQLQEARQTVLDKWGKLDILLNAAGGNLPGATIGPDQTLFDLSFTDFRKVSELNLDGTVLPSIIFGKAMADQKSGVIVNISSMAAMRAITRVVGYSASKAAIDNFTRWMALEMASKFGEGIRVNAIAPGFFIGNQNRRLLTNEDGSLTQRGQQIIDHTPMGRFGEAEELNGTLQWLVSDASKFVTGTVIPVDGGFSIYSGV
ncbi:SDR family oxidoreductase [Rapidithrix thailandica]|uniref:SDR family oxidoreductase n=1 Tax=Rapidithrix thailandica TaxID=413964 RepID=A0AAW9S976_9BACT